ncbi:hypothetical protein BaRGS_00008981 [Batillaria attramentaria]|uniref:Peptidase A1 domain-containing protein n=1 Tax=Batillaria attramentaria TaxID=370345 RepID=A0ABD0LKF7_9CAEN
MSLLSLSMPSVQMTGTRKLLCHKHNTVTFTYIALILLNLVLSSCHAKIVRLPLKQAVGRESGSDGETRDRSRRTADTVTQKIEGISGEGYYLDMDVGTPPKTMQVLVDTGSSNFALAASPDPHISHYFNRSQSSTYEPSINTIYVPYTQGEWEGELGTDIVSLDSLPNVTVRPNIAFITSSTGFFIKEANWQGIVGLAYRSIARPDTLEPFWDTVRREAELEDIFSLQLCGTALSHSPEDPAMVGNLVLGGISEDLFKGEIFYTPIVKEMYYEVVISDIKVGGDSLAMDCKEYNYDKTIVDSGTTHLRLPTRVYHAVVKAIQDSLKGSVIAMPQATFWTGDEPLCRIVPSDPFSLFPDVSISLVLSEAHNKYFTLHLSAQHYLRNVDSCFKFGISPSDSGAVLGALLMESFFVVFDRKNKQIGFAESTCPPPSPDSRSPLKVIDGPHESTANLTACQYMRAVSDDSTLLIVTYVMAGVCVVCSLPLLILLVQWKLRKASEKRRQRHDSEAETGLTGTDSGSRY